MKSRRVTHQGQRLFIADYSNCGMDVEPLMVELEAGAQTLTRGTVGLGLSLADFRGSPASPEALALIKAALARTNPHVRKRAVAGFSSTLPRTSRCGAQRC